MSGPKSGGYTVVSAEERERQALASAQARYDRAVAALDQVTGALSRYRPNLDRNKPAREASSSGEVNARAAQIEARVEEFKKILTGERVKAALASIPRVHIEPRVEAKAKAEDLDTPREEDPAEAAVVKARAMLEKLVAETGQPPDSDVTRALEQVTLSKTEDQRRLALADLRFKVQRVRDALRVAELNDAAKEQVLREIDGCSGAEATRLRRSLEDLPPGASVPVTIAQAQEIARRDRVEADDSFVQGAVVDVLREIGYQVEAPMGVAVAGEGLLLALSGFPDHIARIRASGGQMQFNVVRVGARHQMPPQQGHATDLAAEVVACEVFEEIRQGLATSGVIWNPQRQDAPGQTPLAQTGHRPTAVGRREKRAKRRKSSQQKARSAEE